MLVDTHAHLDVGQFQADRAEVVARARAAGVARMITIGTDLESSARAVEIAAGDPGIWAAVGVHPHDAAVTPPDTMSRLEALAARPRVVAVGEVGLDYFKNYAPHEAQQKLFDDCLALAGRVRKPVVVHCREAHADIARMVRTRRSGLPDPPGIIHCFSGSAEEAAEFLAMGFYISFSGTVTYPRTDALRRAAASIPADRILVETDCPFLAPQPVRGKRNEPAFVTHTAAAVAALRGVGLVQFAAETSANAARVFGLPA